MKLATAETGAVADVQGRAGVRRAVYLVHRGDGSRVPCATCTARRARKVADFNKAEDQFDLSKLPADKERAGDLLLQLRRVLAQLHKASVVARDAGYKQVYWFRGGMPEWTGKSLPTPVISSRLRPRRHRAHRRGLPTGSAGRAAGLLRQDTDRRGFHASISLSIRTPADRGHRRSRWPVWCVLSRLQLLLGARQRRGAEGRLRARRTHAGADAADRQHRCAKCRFRVAGVLLDTLPVPGSLNHVREARADLARLVERRAAGTWPCSISAEEEALCRRTARRLARRSRRCWAGSRRAYAAKNNAQLTGVLEQDWPALHKAFTKPLAALIPLSEGQRAQHLRIGAVRRRMRLNALALGLSAAVLSRAAAVMLLDYRSVTALCWHAPDAAVRRDRRRRRPDAGHRRARRATRSARCSSACRRCRWRCAS
ncbi:MAG: hypothetical protein MZW92_54150 [Comamonadaceae bacterium]|nr:hypothetical protein [Comamonadaceae bacterium]